MGKHEDADDQSWNIGKEQEAPGAQAADGAATDSGSVEDGSAGIAGQAARISQLEEMLAQHRDQLLRARAELENQRRRFDRELEAAHKYAIEKFASDLLGVCDSLEMGMDAARRGGDVASFVEGSELTLKSLLATFEKFGIAPLDPTGERFDPEKHQAMTTQASVEHAPNTVMLTMQKGYLLQGRVLRPAMVIVSRAPEAQTPG
jgi:molecular chaperone GrpE